MKAKFLNIILVLTLINALWACKNEAQEKKADSKIENNIDTSGCIVSAYIFNAD